VIVSDLFVRGRKELHHILYQCFSHTLDFSSRRTKCIYDCEAAGERYFHMPDPDGLVLYNDLESIAFADEGRMPVSVERYPPRMSRNNA
jgi:hypothetical protein